MADTVAIQVPKPLVKEGSSFTATAYFRASGAASTPTNVYYRLDCLSTDTVLADWTSVSAAANVSISITAEHNAIQSQCNRREVKQLLVAADYGLSTQVIDSAIWEVENLHGV
jgi:hypothetical protein